MESDLKFSDLTRTIIGCCMKVHTNLGMGFPEKIYQRCLVLELKGLGLKYELEVDKPVHYLGKVIGRKRLDLLVENKVLVEIKAVSEIDKVYYNQVLNYLKIFGLEVGLLINFGKQSLEFKRLIYSGVHP
jgi:GxxExxY protein